eukprot:scaffold9396_cov100-Isochrysis_galbana.AAC.5
MPAASAPASRDALAEASATGASACSTSNDGAPHSPAHARCAAEISSTSRSHAPADGIRESSPWGQHGWVAVSAETPSHSNEASRPSSPGSATPSPPPAPAPPGCATSNNNTRRQPASPTGPCRGPVDAKAAAASAGGSSSAACCSTRFTCPASQPSRSEFAAAARSARTAGSSARPAGDCWPGSTYHRTSDSRILALTAARSRSVSSLSSRARPHRRRRASRPDSILARWRFLAAGSSCSAANSVAAQHRAHDAWLPAALRDTSGMSTETEGGDGRPSSRGGLAPTDQRHVCWSRPGRGAESAPGVGPAAHVKAHSRAWQSLTALWRPEKRACPAPGVVGTAAPTVAASAVPTRGEVEPGEPMKTMAYSPKSAAWRRARPIPAPRERAPLPRIAQDADPWAHIDVGRAGWIGGSIARCCRGLQAAAKAAAAAVEQHVGAQLVRPGAHCWGAVAAAMRAVIQV